MAAPDSTTPDPGLVSTPAAALADPRRLSIALGVVTIGLGLLVLLLPNRTLLLVGVLVGIQLIVLGLIRIVVNRAFELPRAVRVTGLLLGALTVVAGVFCILRPGTSLLVVALFLALGWMAQGVVDVIHAVAGAPADRGYLLFSGVLSVLAGLTVAPFPGESLRLLAQMAGVLLMLLGASYIATGVRARPLLSERG